MAENAEKTEKITTRSLVKQYFVRWRLLLLAAALVAIGVIIWAHTIPLQYTGTTIFERSKDTVSDTASLRGSENFSVRKETLRHDLAGWDAVEQAVGDLELTKGMERDTEGTYTDKGLRAKQGLIRQFTRTIKIKWEVNTDQKDLVSVSFTHSNPLLAEQVPNILVNNYINRVSEQAAAHLKESQDFLIGEVEKCKEKLTTLVRERYDFEVDNAGTLPDSPGTLQERIMQTDADLDAARLQHEVETQQLKSMQALQQSLTSSAGDPNEPQQIIMGPNPELARRETELRQTREILDEMVYIKKMKENHPTIQMLRLKIKRLEERIQKTEPMVVSEQVYGKSNSENFQFAMQLVRTKASVEGTSREIARLEKRLERYEALLDNFYPIRSKYLELTKKIEDQQAELDRWESKKTTAQMSLAAEVAKRRIHLDTKQAALRQFQPSEPDLMKVFGMALFGGLAFGGALVFLAIRIDQSVITPEQAKAFGIPVYGFVGEILTPRKLWLRRIKRWVITPLVSFLLLATLGLLAFSLSLRVRQPEEYKKWQADESGYLYTKAKQVYSEFSEKLPNPFD
jgi:uncharacterized protein involved in exopolysaccharide biosynthesis